MGYKKDGQSETDWLLLWKKKVKNSYELLIKKKISTILICILLVLLIVSGMIFSTLGDNA